MKNNFESAVLNALDLYADTLGVDRNEAIRLYKQHESTRECIALLVIAQSSPQP